MVRIEHMTKIAMTFCALIGCLGDDVQPVAPSCHPADVNRCTYDDRSIVEFECDPGVDLMHPADPKWADCFLGSGLICCRTTQ